MAATAPLAAACSLLLARAAVRAWLTAVAVRASRVVHAPVPRAILAASFLGGAPLRGSGVLRACAAGGAGWACVAAREADVSGAAFGAAGLWALLRPALE